ncbi:glycine betaine/L-proline ABC transporter ATP-binding protein [Irregularibacter muris]|uniref:Quaternary amine transport ATP-binding protein n=1 Tax=Irregularibacter muris TaxID=1796619 RepID=A0AAE3L3N3_9FIRM|nr:glycine betaine/L-proline ABC transporter ATP-binding protein [Irregularibacter muris]MCR1898548.1 glycine betaine/L-proline ABC transporter ATP-binding protein [Irregularibacter muris]
MSKVEVRELYKIFGTNPKKVISLLEEGKSKAEILADTGNTVGVNNVSFEVEEGEVFVVMGLSGSGKSTLIRCLNRLIEPTKGKILIDGKDIVQSNDHELLKIRREKMAMVFQNFGLLPHRNVLVNVEYGLEIQGVDPEIRRKKAYEAIESVGLKGYEESMPSELSGGMQQRVGLARALANDTDVLLMDEAFSALDPLIRKEMQDELLELQSKMQKTIIFITHDLDEALKLGDRIAIMKDGVVVQIGTPEEILKNPADDYVKEFVQDVNRSKVITASSIMKKPDAIASHKDGPRVAIRKMKEAGISSIFVADRNRKLRGIVTIDDATRLVKEGETSIESIIIEDVPTTSPETLIEELLSIAANTKYPIVVVDNNHTMLGIIVRVSVISGIVGKEDESDD